MSGDDTSFSVLSTAPDAETVYTPSLTTDQRTDDFEIVPADDEGFDEDSLCDSASDASTSATPSVYQYEFEHGRRYHGYMKGRYPLPNDDSELALEDLKHHILLELMEGHLFFADIGDSPQKIIDIGTGTGLWAIDVADKYPNARVIGTDLSPVQSSCLPINLRVFVDDCEAPGWSHGSGFDYTHSRGISQTLRSTKTLITNCYKHLKVGGWIEFQDLSPVPFCDDGSMKDDDPLYTFAKLAVSGMQALGCHRFGGGVRREELEAAGFINVQTTVKKIPIGPWALDKRLQTVGMLMKTVLAETMTAYLAKPFNALGIPAEEREHLKDMAMKSLDDKKVHRYMSIQSIYGQRGPELTADLKHGQ